MPKRGLPPTVKKASVPSWKRKNRFGDFFLYQSKKIISFESIFKHKTTMIIMKKLFSLLVLSLVALNFSFAQTTNITEGKVTYTADLSGMDATTASMIGNMT